jgi:hypothetical protein
MHMHECEGFPPYPAEVDDGQISRDGISVYPDDRSPSMRCFVRSLELWQICARLLTKKRLLNRGAITDPVAVQALTNDALAWTQASEARMKEIMGSLPPDLKEGQAEQDVEGDTRQATLATQRVFLGVLHRLIDYRVVNEFFLSQTLSFKI